jgi:hypothetical protein
LNLTYDEPPSDFAFHFNVRRYSKVDARRDVPADGAALTMDAYYEQHEKTRWGRVETQKHVFAASCTVL